MVRLLVPTSLLQSIPPTEKHFTREMVGKYQCKALAGVSKLWKKCIPYSPPPKVSPL